MRQGPCECGGDKGYWLYPCGDCYQEMLRQRCQRTEPPWDDYAAQLARAGLPHDAIEHLGRGLRESEAWTEAQKFFALPFESAPGLALLSKPRWGKTIAAGWVMEQVLRDKGWNNAPTGGIACPVLFTEASRLTGISERDKLDADWMEHLERVTLLVLDDAGDEATPAGVAALAKLVKLRHSRRRRTVLTSNLRHDAFVVRYGEAVGRRMNVVELGLKAAPRKREGRP